MSELFIMHNELELGLSLKIHTEAQTDVIKYVM